MENIKTEIKHDYLEWGAAMKLINQLYDDENYRMCVFISCGFYLGMHISDIVKLSWNQLLANRDFMIKEDAYGGYRQIRISSALLAIIKDCHTKLQIADDAQNCFIDESGKKMSAEVICSTLEQIRRKYNVNVECFCDSTMQKTFGRKIVDNSGSQPEMAILILSNLYHHQTVDTTKEFLGIIDRNMSDTTMNATI